MAKMSKAQRTAILDAHNYSGDPRYRGIVTACHNPTLDALRREGWMNSEYRITRASLIAAGIDMDALHGDALDEHRSRERAAWREQSYAETDARRAAKVQPRHPHPNSGACWTHKNCEAREALAKLRARLEAEHGGDAEWWGPLVATLAEAIPEPLEQEADLNEQAESLDDIQQAYEQRRRDWTNERHAGQAHVHDMVESAMTDTCNHGCKVYRCACGETEIRHYASYGCTIGRAEIA